MGLTRPEHFLRLFFRRYFRLICRCSNSFSRSLHAHDFPRRSANRKKMPGKHFSNVRFECRRRVFPEVFSTFRPTTLCSKGLPTRARRPKGCRSFSVSTVIGRPTVGPGGRRCNRACAVTDGSPVIHVRGGQST